MYTVTLGWTDEVINGEDARQAAERVARQHDVELASFEQDPYNVHCVVATFRSSDRTRLVNVLKSEDGGSWTEEGLERHPDTIKEVK